MVDVSTLGLISMLIRIIGSVLFIVVIYKQLKLRFNKYDDNLNGLRNLLIGLTLVPIIFNFIAIVNNYVRWQNGVQSETINNISFVLGSLASTATALLLYLIYKYK